MIVLDDISERVVEINNSNNNKIEKSNTKLANTITEQSSTAGNKQRKPWPTRCKGGSYN